MTIIVEKEKEAFSKNTMSVYCHISGMNVVLQHCRVFVCVFIFERCVKITKICF